ncbi:MAG: DUF368 domain-containing protein [Lachnospiraceae bacterium]
MKLLWNIIRGALIGMANVIPGVSGGTMMVSMGIYDTIIGCITNFLKQWKKSIVTLFPYIIGMGLGIVLSAFSIELLFDRFPLPTALLFIGLIFGGIPMLLQKIKGGKLTLRHVVLFFVFFALVVGLQLLGKSAGLEHELTLSPVNLVIAFLLGAIASATMVIPGVSGSMVMMILGYYNAVIGLINDCVEALLTFHIPGLLQCVGILLPFGIGVLLGIFWVAKLIEYLMKHHQKETYCAILGLVAASPFPVFMNAGIEEISAGAVVAAVVTFALGFIGALRLGKEA